MTCGFRRFCAILTRNLFLSCYQRVVSRLTFPSVICLIVTSLNSTTSPPRKSENEPVGTPARGLDSMTYAHCALRTAHCALCSGSGSLCLNVCLVTLIFRQWVRPLVCVVVLTLNHPFPHLFLHTPVGVVSPDTLHYTFQSPVGNTTLL